MYKHILIATDGSELADKGLQQGLELAAKLGSAATVVTVTEPFPMMTTASSSGWVASPQDIQAYDDNQKAHAQEILKKAEDAAKAAGVTIKPIHIAERWPAEAIIEFSERANVDLIVMTSHGRRGIGRLLLGSQTNEVLTHTKTPILIVK